GMAVNFGRIESGSGCPANSCSLGLGSNKSTWLGPPSMNSQMMDLAVGGWSGFFGLMGSPDVALAAIKPSSCSIWVSAIPASSLARVKKSRRLVPRRELQRWLFSFIRIPRPSSYRGTHWSSSGHDKVPQRPPHVPEACHRGSDQALEAYRSRLTSPKANRT